MKIPKSLLLLILLAYATGLLAHCPTSYKTESACMWLDNNFLFIYDHKLEHNGPYKDLKKAQVTGFKNKLGEELPFKKVARGILKIESTEIQKMVTVVLTKDKKNIELNVSKD